MAQEHLKRTPTVHGNSQKYTLSCWVKRCNTNSSVPLFHAYDGSASNRLQWEFRSTNQLAFNPGGTTDNFQVETINTPSPGSDPGVFRDTSSWMHCMVSVELGAKSENDRCRIYINGIRQDLRNTSGYASPVEDISGRPHQINTKIIHHILGIANSNVSFAGQNTFKAYLMDYYMVDGQSLEPEVFGYYKEGRGYISSGPKNATEFRKGQWVPKSPRLVKIAVNRGGGFGANGFYLPMNDGNNIGADFHCTPNTIIKLQEDLAQPKCSPLPTSSEYTDVLRDDPYAANLVLAIPFISGGRDGVGGVDGYGDYSASIKGSGTNKPVTLQGSNGSSLVGTAPFYGSSADLNIGNSDEWFSVPASSDFDFGTDPFTMEVWIYPLSTQTTNARLFAITDNRSITSMGTNAGAFDMYFTGASTNSVATGDIFYFGNSAYGGDGLPTGQWNHVAVERIGNKLITIVNGSVNYVDIIPTTTPFGNANDPFYFGQIGSNAAPNYGFAGYVSDLRVYKGVAKYKGGSFDIAKPWTPVSISNWRAVADNPRNNFATWSWGASFDGSMSDGMLNNTANDNFATMGVSSGRWYYEVRIEDPNTGDGQVHHLGWTFSSYNEDPNSGGAFNGGSQGRCCLRSDGSVQTASGRSIDITNTDGTPWGGTPLATGDIVGIFIRLDGASDGSSDGEVIYTKNGGSAYIQRFNIRDNGGFHALPLSRTNGLNQWTNFGQNPSFSGYLTGGNVGTNTDANGRGVFKYAPSFGGLDYLALCSENLPDPAVPDPGEHFKVVLWNGNNDANNIKCGFKPDLVWIKNRDFGNWHAIYDSIRGPYLELNSNSDDINRDRSSADGLRSFNEDGFTAGADDNAGGRINDNYIAFCWKGGGDAVTNNDGTIQSLVSANQQSGFSVVKWTGNGVEGATVGHGLTDKKPKFILQKNISGSAVAWRIWHEYLGDTYGATSGNVHLNFTNVLATYDTQRLTGSTSTTFRTTGTTSPYSNGNGVEYIDYCWAEVDGFSKFSTFVGNSSANGCYVYCGFKPSLIILKAVTSPNTTGEWCMIDSSRNSVNPSHYFLVPNGFNGDDTGAAIDFLANGFKLRLTSANFNNDNTTYIFCAWAESPFKYANAK